MLERDHRSLRRRTPSGRSRPPHPSPSPRRRPEMRQPSKPIAILKRCASEPAMPMPRGSVGSEDGDRNTRRWGRTGSEIEEQAVMFRPQTCTDVFASSPSLLSLSPRNTTHEMQIGYKKEAKVVVKVTVEGSPGAVRTMVKLGSTVAETINDVVHKYNQEGRTPKLDIRTTSSLHLHHSYFSLQSLDKSETIGDIGSRSFYLRKSCNDDNNPTTALFSSEAVTPTFFMPNFLGRSMQKIVRRARKLWKILICSQ